MPPVAFHNAKVVEEDHAMTLKHFVVIAFALGFSSSALADDAEILKPDTPTKVGTVEAVCTGVGLDARQNPAWTAYPLKIEIAGRGGQYLGDVQLTLRRKDSLLATVKCDGPWVLFKTDPGAYRVDVGTDGQTATSNAYVPTKGQGRIIIRFPSLGGEVSPKPVSAAQGSSAATN